METAKPQKTMYDSSVGEIAFKHFIAGFMQGLGGFFITLLTWAALYFFTIKYVLPQLSTYLADAKSMIQSAQELQRNASNLMAPSGSTQRTPGSEAGTPTGGFVVTPELIKQVQQMQGK